MAQSADVAEYLIAQYTEDLFRREPRNVGVFVRKGGRAVARFFGEAEDGVIDGRKLKSMAAPDVYRQWVEYWRRTLDSTDDPFAEVQRSSKGNYAVVNGGMLSDTGADSPEKIADLLFAALVAAGGGFANALWEPDPEVGELLAEEAKHLSGEVADAFRAANILATGHGDLASGNLLVSAPVRYREPVRGTTSVPHRPEFSQQNGRLTVMETVDFEEQAKNRIRDHAGFIAFMFGDLRELYREGVEAVAVIRLEPEAEAAEHIRYGLSMLSSTASRVVNWLDPEARTDFVETRRRIAVTSHQVESGER